MTGTARPEGLRTLPECAATHWRGGFALAGSFWLGFVLPALVIGWALGLATLVVHVGGAALRATSLALLLGWPLACAVLLWGAVGVWRAAGAHAARAARPFVAARAVSPARAALRAHAARVAGPAVRAAVLAGLLVLAVASVVNFGAHAGLYVRLLGGADPLGAVQAVPSPDGRRLRLAGPLAQGDAGRVLALLDGLPQLQLLELDMPGGRFAEAGRLAEAVAQRGLRTRVVGACHNACALVFLAGSRRQLMAGARLGFHRLAPGSVNPLFGALARRQQASMYRQAGLPENLILKALATAPPGLWHPDTDELLGAGLIGVPGRPLDVELPAGAGATLADHAEALRSHALWQAIERRHPGSTPAAAQRMADARATAADDDATQVAGQRIIEALMPRLLAEAGSGLWEPYLALLAEQLEAVGTADPLACQGVLASDAAVRRGLPEPLPGREAAWLVAAVAGLEAPEGPPRKPNALEREVMRRALGARAAALLGGFVGPPTGGVARDCAQARALVAEVSRLPAAERRLALRFMFGPR